MSSGPPQAASRSSGVAGRLKLARLDDLGTMTARDELLSFDDLHGCLLGLGSVCENRPGVPGLRPAVMQTVREWFPQARLASLPWNGYDRAD